MMIQDDGGRRGRFKIRGAYYPTYRSVRAEIKRRLGAYSVGGPKDLTPDDVDWFVHLIREMHPYADEKLAKPVVGIKKYNRYGHQGDNLMLLYEDGSSLPFSWNKCCKGKASSDAVSVKGALRAAVQDQTSAVMDAAFLDRDTIVCPMSGELINRCEAHVDHAPPKFADLVNLWLIDMGVDLEQLPLADDPQGGAILPDGHMRSSWRTFHERHAVLRVVSARWNTSAEARC
jgi:hypothetical protein